jgi:hypothetical protein
VSLLADLRHTILSLLFVATAIAAFVPARRIGRIEPQALLRQE